MHKLLLIVSVLFTSCSYNTNLGNQPILGKWQGGYTQCTNCGVYTVYNLEYFPNNTLIGTEETFNVFSNPLYDTVQILYRTVSGTYITNDDTLSENLTYYNLITHDTLDTSLVVRYSCEDTILTIYDPLPHTLHKPFN
jgi:hypothetical protein